MAESRILYMEEEVYAHNGWSANIGWVDPVMLFTKFVHTSHRISDTRIGLCVNRGSLESSWRKGSEGNNLIGNNCTA